MNLPGVPESISREQYLNLVAAVGLDVDDLRRLEFQVNGIYAEVFAVDPETGQRSVDPGTNEIALHRIYIPVVDGGAS